tara:strand:+ start:45 stop:992 length:948 start_codon:yes stop_codon:yes gene_type:complete
VLTKLIPFCFLIATVLTILKLEKDNELIVLWTSGLNKIHIVNHLIRVSLLIMILQLILTTVINPKLLNISRTILKYSQLEFVSSMFKEKQFNDTVEGLTIFVDKKNENKIYKNILIRDESSVLSSVGTKSSTIFAKSGYMSEDEKNLILLNGNIQKLNPNGDINIIKFDKTTLNLAGISTKSISEPKMQETSTIKIIKCIQNKNVDMHNCNPTKKTKMDVKIEINKRFGMPFYIPLIALVCCFLLASRRDKKMSGFNKYIYSFIGIVILTFAEITVRYSGTSWNHTAIYYLIPIVMMPIFYFILIRKFKYENLYR